MRALALALIATLGAAPACAQGSLEDASEHFERGVTFFSEGRYDAALAEFSQAYAIAPAPPTLYNLARVHAALGHAVEAAAAYERYLHEAGADLTARRRREAEQALAEQRSRVGSMQISSNVSGATINVDGTDVATTPMTSALPLSAGAHALELRAAGYESIRLAISVAGRQVLTLELTMRAAIERRGTLRVESSLPEVDIVVDGQSVGHTPLASTLPLVAGMHTVRASRSGYTTEEHSVSISDGAEVRLAIELHRMEQTSDVGHARVRLPNAPHRLRVDGEQMLESDFDLPAGRHLLEVEVTERQPYRETVNIEIGVNLTINPPLEWTLDARRLRLEGSSAQQVNGAIVTLVGAGLLVGGVSILIWNETQISATDARITEIMSMLSSCAPPSCNSDALIAEGARLSSQQDVQNGLRIATIAGSILGAGVLAIGLPIWVSAPSSEGIDAAARASARLHLGPGGLGVSGRF